MAGLDQNMIYMAIITQIHFWHAHMNEKKYKNSYSQSHFIKDWNMK